MNSIVYLSIFSLTFVEIGGTAAVAHWAKTDDWVALCGGLCMFTILGCIMAFAIRTVDHINTVNALWQSFSISGVSIVSVCCFGETLTPRQWVGVVLAIGASACFV